MPVSISEFVPRDYRRSSERERLFLRKERKNLKYDDTALAAIEYLCTKRYRNRPELGYLLQGQKIALRYEGKLSQVYFSSEAATSRFRKLVQDPQIHLILMRFSYLTLTTPHALAIVIDKIAKRVEFYDPNGADSALKHHGNLKIRMVMEFLKREGGLGAEYQPMRWDQTCPRYSVQIVEGFLPRERGELGGYCVIWSLFLLELRILYPHRPSAEVQLEFMQQLMRRVVPTIKLENRNLVDVLQKYISNASPKAEDGKRMAKEFREFIKNYLSHLHKLMNTPEKPSPRPASRPIQPTPRCQPPTSRCRSPMYSQPIGPSPRPKSRSRSPERQKQQLSSWINIPPGSQKLIIRFK